MLGGNLGSLLYGDVSVMCNSIVSVRPLGSRERLRYVIVAHPESSI